MGAVFRKEFRSFFTSPVGYIVLAVIEFFAGLFFVMYNITYYSSDLSSMFSSLFMVTLLVLPLVTMRQFSEEKRQKTDQALLTSPVNLTSIVLGKFFASMLMFALSLVIILVFIVIIAFQVTPDAMVIIGNYVGILLVGGLVIAIGLLISSLTESQLIAAIGAIGISVLMMLVDSVASSLSSIKIISTVLTFLSVPTRYNSFTTGVVNYDDIIFFISMQALLLFLTVRVLDRKRWS